MDKINLPRGLIRYDTERRIEAKTSPDEKHLPLLRPRTFYYMSVLVFVAALVVYGQITRKPFEIHALHSRNPLFVNLSDGHVRNGYDIKILNKTHDNTNFSLRVENIQYAHIEIRSAGHITPDQLPTPADKVESFHVFVTAAPQKENSQDINFILRNNTTGREEKYKSMFISREK